MTSHTDQKDKEKIDSVEFHPTAKYMILMVIIELFYLFRISNSRLEEDYFESQLQNRIR